MTVWKSIKCSLSKVNSFGFKLRLPGTPANNDGRESLLSVPLGIALYFYDIIKLTTEKNDQNHSRGTTSSLTYSFSLPEFAFHMAHNATYCAT